MNHSMFVPDVCQRGHRFAVDTAEAGRIECPYPGCPRFITRLYLHIGPSTIAVDPCCDNPTIAADTPMSTTQFMSGECLHTWRPGVDEVVEVEQIAYHSRDHRITIRRRTEWDAPESLLLLTSSDTGAILVSSP